MPKFEVVDLRLGQPSEPHEVVGTNPEQAVFAVMGIEAARSVRGSEPIAKVYWQPAGKPRTMVRLYAKT